MARGWRGHHPSPSQWQTGTETPRVSSDHASHDATLPNCEQPLMRTQAAAFCARATQKTNSCKLKAVCMLHSHSFLSIP